MTYAEMYNVKQHKNNTYKVYKKWIQFEIDAGDNKDDIRNRHIETLKNNVDILNNPYRVCKTKTIDNLIIAECEGILQAINELVPEIKTYKGRAKLNNDIVNFEFKELYHYKLLTPGMESIKYMVIKELIAETEHKINNKNIGRFAVDLENKFIILSR